MLNCRTVNVWWWFAGTIQYTGFRQDQHCVIWTAAGCFLTHHPLSTQLARAQKLQKISEEATLAFFSCFPADAWAVTRDVTLKLIFLRRRNPGAKKATAAIRDSAASPWRRRCASRRSPWRRTDSRSRRGHRAGETGSWSPPSRTPPTPGSASSEFTTRITASSPLAASCPEDDESMEIACQPESAEKFSVFFFFFVCLIQFVDCQGSECTRIVGSQSVHPVFVFQ